MPLVKKKKCVPYTPEQIYVLVNDIEAYPEFLPWCHEANILAATDDEVRASLLVGKAGLHKTFSTINRLHPHSMIEIQLLDGPFKHLEGYWRFTAKAERHCLIELDLSFEFAASWLGACFAPIFTPIAQSLVDAFVQRAHDIYQSS